MIRARAMKSHRASTARTVVTSSIMTIRRHTFLQMLPNRLMLASAALTLAAGCDMTMTGTDDSGVDVVHTDTRRVDVGADHADVIVTDVQDARADAPMDTGT